MSLTPLDIQKKEFKKTMRGCDSEEVELFLEEVSEYVEQLLRESEQKDKEIAALKTSVEEHKESADSAQESLKKATPVDKEAELIVREAELKALEVLENNRSEVNRLKDELVMLKQQKNSFIKRLKHLFAAQIDLIDVLEIEDVDLDEIKELKTQKTRKKLSSKQVAEIPAFKRNTQEPTGDIDLDKLKSKPAAAADIDSIKKQAKNILNEREKQNPLQETRSNSDDIDLDDILGRIGEEKS